MSHHQRLAVSVIHGLHRVAGHWDVLGVIGSPATLLSLLVKVTAGTHEAAHHGSNDSHEEQDGRSNTSDGGRAELEEHAALLLPLSDPLEAVQATVALVAIPTTEGHQGTGDTVVPRAILIHVPQAVISGTHLPGGEEDGHHWQSHSDKGHFAYCEHTVQNDEKVDF